MARFLRKPPAWFTVMAAILVLWGLAGAAALYAHFAYGPGLDPNATSWDWQLYRQLPLWHHAAYVIAVSGGLLGSLALLLRSKWAVPLYVLSLVAVVIQFGYVFLGTQMIAVKGVWTIYFPLFIFAVALFQLWLSRRAYMRGWIN